MKTSRKNRFLSMTSTALLLALVWSLALTQSALAAITTQWDAATGTLTITSDGSDSIVITCETSGEHRGVLVNGQALPDGQGMSVLCVDVMQLIVNGGPGDNSIDLRGVSPVDFPNLAGDYYVAISGGAGNDDMWGSHSHDVMNGGDGNDFMRGGWGNDMLDGGEGNDIMNGEEGDDFMLGDAGDDTQLGGWGNDTMDGGEGDDALEGGWGNDAMDGGGGNDLIILMPGSADIVNDSGGTETLDFSGAASAITIDLDLQNVDQAVDAAGNTVQLQGQLENFVGSAFSDTVSIDPLSVPRTMDGGAGANDTLNFDSKGLAVTDDGATITVPGYAPVTYTGFETVNITDTGSGYRLYLPLILR